MTDAILLDTHIALWLGSGDERLRLATRKIIERHWRSGMKILVSAVTGWEIALLVDAGRIVLECSVEAWMERFLGRPGIEAVGLTWSAATRAYRLHHLKHRDPADRLLIATAIECSAPFVTYDVQITDFAKYHGGQYGFRLAA